MDEILRKVAHESQSCDRMASVVKLTHEAIEIVCDKSSLMRIPMNELRDKCLQVFVSCLAVDHKNHKNDEKLIQFAVNGLQVMVRQQIYWVVNSNRDEQQLPSQLIQCISLSINNQRESTQLELLSILLEMSSNMPSLVSVDNIDDIIELCCRLSTESTHSCDYQMAIEATASQSCHQFIKYCLNSEYNERQINEEIIPLFRLIVNKLTNCDQNYQNNISVLLRCVQYFLITIPNDSPIINQQMVDIIWETLIPIVIKLLSWSNLKDTIDCNNKSSDWSQTQLNDAMKIGRGSQSVSSNLNTCYYKTYIYKIATELLRLFGRISCLRPALESLFHRILLYPPVCQRHDALKWIQEVLKNTKLVVNAAIEEPVFGKISRSKDLDLLHIIVDSLEECIVSTDTTIAWLSVSSIVTFLHSLQSMCNQWPNLLNQNTIEYINQMYTTLEDAEFEGFNVRNCKPIGNSNNDCLDESTKVSFDVLKRRIVGFDATLETDSYDFQSECKSQNSPNISKQSFEKTNLNNFQLESYKLKLKQILASKSIDSNDSEEAVDAGDADDAIETQTVVTISSEKLNQDCNPSQLTPHSVDSSAPKRDSISTNYEEAEEYQRSGSQSNTSCTEGPELEDCMEEMADERYDCNRGERYICMERTNARTFVRELKTFLPNLLSLRTSVEADHVLQVFASNYCIDNVRFLFKTCCQMLWKGNGLPFVDGICIVETPTLNISMELYENQRQSADNESSDEITEDTNTQMHLIINSDGIYLSTYSALLLNLKLIRSKFYTTCGLTVPMTEEEFISDILNSGILVYISGHWLAELYQSVLADNLLGNAGYECKDELNVSLINILTDMDGLGSCEPGAQQLSDYRRLEKAVTNHIVSERDTESSAAHKLVRRLLTAFWDSILGCLGIVFRGDFSHKSGELKASVAFNNLLGSDAKAIMNRKMMITSTLDGLQIAAKLCIQLGLQSRCDKVFELLAFSVMETKRSELNDWQFSTNCEQKKRSVIEVIKNRLPFSLHTSHVLSLQVVLSCGLEIGSHCSACWRYVFKCCQYIMQLEHNYFTSRHSSLLTSTRTSLCSLIKSSPKQCELYYNCETTLESTSMPGINEFEEINTETCINNLIAETTSQNNDSILKDKQLERVIDILSHLVDLLFEDAANKLNLRSLNGFLTQLCVCSGEQLSLLSKTESTSNCYSGKSLLLFRLSDVILRTARSGRPVLHFIKCWSSVSSHLVEAATHWDHFVAKKSISTIHDIINVFLSTHNELPHFHFNEALFKPFENLLLLELCDTDVQELIISSICEFVEGTTEDIRSGWRSLFGALRGIRLPQVCPQTKSCDSQELEVERVRQLGVILDIFEAFLHTDNLQVFANAAVDCLLCLLKLVQNPQTIANEMSINDETPKSLDLCLISLKYLHQFSSMLRSMYEMPACPLFSSHKLSHTIRIIDTTHLMSKTGVAPHLPIVITLDRMDKPNKILNIWFLLIDEYLRSINKCNPKHVNTAVEMLFQWLNCLIEIPGPIFAIYCVNHILLPSLQLMTRQLMNCEERDGDYRQTNLTLSTLRHLYGLTADLIVNIYQQLNYTSKSTETAILGVDLMLKQSLLVYIESLNGKYDDTIAKLSCACIRHILSSISKSFDENLWQITIDCLSVAHEMTLQSLHNLVNALNTSGEHFVEDFDQIQLICKRNANQNNQQLYRLANQIFLLESQRNIADMDSKYRTYGDNHSNPIRDNRSFVFVINDGQNTFTVSYRVLVIQLTSHWLILQIISSLLLTGIQPVMPNVDKLVHPMDNHSKPSVLSMNINECNTLLALLSQTYSISFAFDSKPSLKFLIQKMNGSDIPSNLYQFSSLVWSVQYSVLMFLSNNQSNSLEFKTQLKQSFVDLCHTYTQYMQLDANQEFKIDQISHQSLYFLHTSNEELLNIISNYRTNRSPNGVQSDTIHSTCDNTCDNSQTTQHLIKKSNVGECSDDSVKENGVEMYGLATESKMNQMMAQYKKYKVQHSPIPPIPPTPPNPTTTTPSTPTLSHIPNTIDANNTNTINDKTRSLEMIQHQKHIHLMDSQAFQILWSEIISMAIELHVSLPSHQFKQLMTSLLPAIQQLTVYCNDNRLRHTISLWITKVVDIHVIDQ